MKYHLHYIKLLLLMFCIGGAVSACKDYDDEKKESDKPELTIFIHQPYSGLESYLDHDLQEVNKALRNNPEICKKINILYFRNNYITGKLYKKNYHIDPTTGEESIEDVLLKEYPLSQTDYTTFSGLHQILSDVVSIGKTDKYGMVIGCHGSGWIPTKEDKSSRAASGDKVIRKVFGKIDNDTYNATYKTLGKAIEATGKKMEFILVDDCYSQNIEVAYDLRNASNFLIASITEMGGDGQDYETAIPHLLEGNYKAICDYNKDYYTQVGNPWKTSTISITDCSQVESMVSIMKEIYSSANLNDVDRDALQVFDGYDCEYGYNIFYDFSQYVHLLCNDAPLLAKFDAQMKKLIVYNVFTPEFNSVFFDYGAHHKIPDHNYLRPITTCCGITCSDPCTERQNDWKETSWYKATH